MKNKELFRDYGDGDGDVVALRLQGRCPKVPDQNRGPVLELLGCAAYLEREVPLVTAPGCATDGEVVAKALQKTLL